MKQCLACGVSKPLSEFSAPPSLGRPLATCKACTYAREKQYKLAARARRERKKLDTGAKSMRELEDTRVSCARCGQAGPCHGDVQREREWSTAWSHRCPHGEPCPGVHPVPSGASSCDRCVSLPTLEVVA